MKKNLVALLLVLVVVSFGLFAVPADPSDVSFKVETTVSQVNDMKLVTAAVTTAADYDDAEDFTGNVTYNGTSYSDFPYIAGKSNNRSGFTITMTAKAMESTNTSGSKTYIGYTVTAGNSVITVDKDNKTDAIADPESKKVLVTGPQTALYAASAPVSIVITAADYDNAIESTYIGTITFDYLAN